MTIKNIHQAFINEAKAAPVLFSDLAKVELYIAESYRARAFIELLQNADDAGATKFLIRLHGNKLVVANDGRVFTSDDIQSLCRSGASNKQRGSGVIGYRGIGFKSVAGISSEIDVISGEYHFRFSKPLTKVELNSNQDAPLIRIPHNLEITDESVSIAKQLIEQENVSTVFVMSGLDLRVLSDEANAFEESTLLFLNSIQKVAIDLPNVSKSFVRSAIKRPDGYTIETIGNNEENAWLIAGLNESCEKIAFRVLDDVIIPAEKEKSVIHAFMPTTEFAGAFLKMNGDFSTDPSRKGVDMDDLSNNTFKKCTDLLAELIGNALKHNQLAGIFSAFVTSSAPVELGRFRKFLREALTTHFEKNGLFLAGFKSAKLTDIRLFPEWINYQDYELLCQKVPHIPQKTLSVHPDFQAFLKWLGVKPLNIEDALNFSKINQISVRGCVQIIAKFARQNRFDMTEERLTLLKSSLILPLQNETVIVEQYTKGELHSEAFALLNQATEIDDIRFLFRRLGLEPLLGVVEKPKSTSAVPKPATTTAKVITKSLPQNSIFKAEPAIKQWRSAEQNTLAWFSALKIVSSAKDVSKANIGYDLEVALNDGRQFYVEIKSVKRLGDSIRMTNNEHCTAHQHGKNYLLAMVVNSDPLEIRIISDPVRTLSLDKRCEQWSWYCESYLDEATDFLNITAIQ